MVTKHIEFILQDEVSLQAIDRMHELYPDMINTRDEFDRLQEFIEAKYHIDPVIDAYQSLAHAWNGVLMGFSRKEFVELIKKEQQRRQTRKRQPKIIKERCVALGLWDI